VRLESEQINDLLRCQTHVRNPRGFTDIKLGKSEDHAGNFKPTVTT